MRIVLQKYQWLEIVLSLILSTGFILITGVWRGLVSFCYRSVLDFDFEKLCSVSLSNINVYACLVCGKYFQGINQLCMYCSCTPAMLFLLVLIIRGCLVIMVDLYAHMSRACLAIIQHR